MTHQTVKTSDTLQAIKIFPGAAKAIRVSYFPENKYLDIYGKLHGTLPLLGNIRVPLQHPVEGQEAWISCLPLKALKDALQYANVDHTSIGKNGAAGIEALPLTHPLHAELALLSRQCFTTRSAQHTFGFLWAQFAEFADLCSADFHFQPGTEHCWKHDSNNLNCYSSPCVFLGKSARVIANNGQQSHVKLALPLTTQITQSYVMKQEIYRFLGKAPTDSQLVQVSDYTTNPTDERSVMYKRGQVCVWFRQHPSEPMIDDNVLNAAEPTACFNVDHKLLQNALASFGVNTTTGKKQTTRVHACTKETTLHLRVLKDSVYSTVVDVPITWVSPPQYCEFMATYQFMASVVHANPLSWATEGMLVFKVGNAGVLTRKQIGPQWVYPSVTVQGDDYQHTHRSLTL